MSNNNKTKIEVEIGSESMDIDIVYGVLMNFVNHFSDPLIDNSSKRTADDSLSDYEEIKRYYNKLMNHFDRLLSLINKSEKQDIEQKQKKPLQRFSAKYPTFDDWLLANLVMLTPYRNRIINGHIEHPDDNLNDLRGHWENNY